VSRLASLVPSWASGEFSSSQTGGTAGGKPQSSLSDKLGVDVGNVIAVGAAAVALVTYAVHAGFIDINLPSFIVKDESAEDDENDEDEEEEEDDDDAEYIYADDDDDDYEDDDEDEVDEEDEGDDGGDE
jgi:phosphopantothenoylcysteine synthetase/decarboxylase